MAAAILDTVSKFQPVSICPVTRQSHCRPLTIQSEHDKQVLRLHAHSDYFVFCLTGVNSSFGTGISQWHFPWCTEMQGSSDNPNQNTVLAK